MERWALGWLWVEVFKRIGIWADAWLEDGLLSISTGAQGLNPLVGLGIGPFLDKPTLGGPTHRPSLLRSPLIWEPNFGDLISQLVQFLSSTHWAYSMSSSSLLGITNCTRMRMSGLNPLINTLSNTCSGRPNNTDVIPSKT